MKLRRRKRSGCLVSAILGVAPLFACPLFMGGDPPFGLLAAVVAVGLLSLAGVLLASVSQIALRAIWLGTFRCPRCGGRFMPPFFERPSCQHCGLAVGAEVRDSREP